MTDMNTPTDDDQVDGGVAGTLVFNQWPDLTGWIACVAAASAVAGVTYRHAAKARQ